MSRIIASCSFGKDSIAAILVALEHGIKIDEVFYCRVMFDDHLSGEFPEHEDFINNIAIPKLRDEYGLKTVIIDSKITYLQKFYTPFCRGKNIGKIRGFPYLLGAWCNGLKMGTITDYKKMNGQCKYIVGIAADETKRIEKQIVKDTIMPLVDYGITEAMAFDICKEAGLLSPVYESMNTKRLGCWFCHNANIKQLKALRQKHPELWGKLLELQKDSNVSFRTRKTMFDLEERFAKEEMKDE